MNFKRLPRFTGVVLFVFGLLLLIAYLQPHLIGGDIHKMSLAILGALIGFWIDTRAFPYARPDGYLKVFDWRDYGKRENAADYAIVPGYELVFALACLRRALMMGLGMVVIGLAI